MLEKIIRADHAGEMGASFIYQTSLGAAELQTGTLTCLSPENFSLAASMTAATVLMSLASTSDSFLLTSTTVSLPSFSAARPVTTLRNSGSSFSSCSAVTAPSSAYSPILLAGLAQKGLPPTRMEGSCLRLNQMMGPSLG